jgi:hypothetical protein
MSTTVVTPTTPTFLSPAPVPAVVLATGDTLGTVYTLDLKTKKGAQLFVMVGRRLNTALTRSAFVICRRTDNNALVVPFSAYDTETISSTTAAASTTVSSGGASGTNTVTVASASGFAVGNLICLHSDDTAASRVEFAKIHAISGSVLTVDRNFRTSHNSADRVTNLATVRTLFLPGGDIWEIYAANNSGQSLVFLVEGYTLDSDTGVTT